MTMQKLVCLACYGDRLASVFENSAELRLYHVSANNICPAGRLPLPSKDPVDRISATLACGASFVVCGAIQTRSQSALEHAGLEVAGFVNGSVEEVLDSLARGDGNGLGEHWAKPPVTGKA